MTHKRQNSTGNFSSGLNVDQNNPLETSFSSLAYFMNVSKLMEDEIMVPTKLKDKTFDNKQSVSHSSVLDQTPAENGTGTSNGNGRPPKLERKPSYGDDQQKPSDSLMATIDEMNESDDDASGGEADALEQYRFIRLIRSQLLQAKPFSNVEEYNANVLKTKKFKRTYDSMNYHYRQLMTILDNLSTDARSITETYRENV